MEERVITLPHQGDVKLLYITDTHFTATSPKSRKDNLSETGLQKMQEVVQLAVDHDVDAVLHGGDFFDKPDTTDLIAGKVAGIVKQFHVPLIVVPGGHDLFGNNIRGLARTKLGLFQKAGLVDLLIHPTSNQIILKNKNIAVQLTGTASHYQIDYENITEDYCLSHKNADFAIHTVHGMLMPKPFIPQAAHVLVKDILQTKADLTLSGHYHLGFEPICLEDKWFYNCGAMVRNNNNIKEMERQVQVALITISGSGVTIEPIILSTALPAEEVLDRTAILKHEEREVRVQGFIGKIRETQALKAINLHTIIENLSQNQSLPPRVVETAVERVGKMEELFEELVPASKNELRYIRKVILHNFQSHKHTELELENGINVFTGDTDSGKTAIIRGLRWVFNNEPRGDEFVHYDTDECYVTVIYSDGTEVTRRRRKNKNSYHIKYPNGATHDEENFGVDVPLAVREALGIYKLQVDTDKTLVVNLADQLDRAFLFGETDATKAKAIGSIVKTHLLDAAERDIQKDYTNTNLRIRDTEKQIDLLQQELQAFSDLDGKEKRIQKIEKMMGKLETKQALFDKLATHYKRLSGLKAEAEKVKVTIELLRHLPKAEATYYELKEKYSLHRQLSSAAEKIQTRNRNIKAAVQILNHLRNLDKAIQLNNKLQELFMMGKTIEGRRKTLVNLSASTKRQQAILEGARNLSAAISKTKQLEALVETEKTLREKQKMLVGCAKEIKREEAVIAKVRHLREAERKLELLSQKFTVNKQLTMLFAKYSNINKSLQKEQNNHQKARHLLETAVNEYIPLLQEQGTCPTCMQSITDDVVEHIIHELKGVS